MLCPKCKKQLKDGSKFCGYCGNKFNTAAKAPAPIKTKPVVQQPQQQPQTVSTATAASSAAKCKYCGSTSLQAMKKGVSAGALLTGALIAGPIGMAVGAAGMNDTKIVCLSCGRDQ